MVEKLRVAVVMDRASPSLGLHGLHLAFHGLPGVELAALVDSVDDGVDEIRQKLGAHRRFRSMAEMLSAEPIDIVVLTSRHPADHAGQIELALAHRCHIYCEKPLTTSLAEAERLVQQVKQAGVRFCMAHPGRYAPSFRTIKQILEGGEIGDVLRVETYGKCDHRGGGEDLMTLGTHLLDLMTFFLGKASSVYAELWTNGKLSPQHERTPTIEAIGPCAGDEIQAEFRFDRGIRGTFYSRKDLFSYRGAERPLTHMGLAIVGTEGVVSTRFTDLIPDCPVRLARTRYPAAYGEVAFTEVAIQDARTIPGAAPLDPTYLSQWAIPQTHFFHQANRFAAWDLLEAIAENRATFSGIHHAYDTLEMIYGIYASHVLGKKIYFPLVDKRHPLEYM